MQTHVKSVVTPSTSQGPAAESRPLSLMEQFDQVDCEFAGDHIQVDVDAVEDQQFPPQPNSDGELTGDMEQDRQSSDSEYDSGSELFASQSEVETVVESSDSVSQVGPAPSELSLGIVTFKPGAAQFANLEGDPAFASYIRRLVSKECEAERTELKRQLDKAKSD